jgi:adenylate cyclase class IV
LNDQAVLFEAAPGPDDGRQRHILELKARDLDPARSLQSAIEFGATDCGVLRQLDTYFAASRGRLKLREQERSAQLIHYPHSAGADANESCFRPVDIYNLDQVKALLSAALGVIGVVEMDRHLLLWRKVRIHLDDVRDQGRFVGLEAAIDRGSNLEAEHSQLDHLRTALGMHNELLIGGSYIDDSKTTSAIGSLVDA